MIEQTASGDFLGINGEHAVVVRIMSASPTAKSSATRLDWKNLLCDQRWSNDSEDDGLTTADGVRTQFESDYDRIVFSQPFRRLARKTQVHPMAVNDHVHNRLTHSIEVVSVGRSFGRRITNLLKENSELPEGRQENDLVWILMASCAAHDIGNPPFGHAGEEAIRDWAASHQDIVFTDSLDENLKRDVLIFEGNAQGFRVACRNDNDLAGHLRLTYATLGAMVKYPWGSEDARATNRKKYNHFTTEKDIFEAVFKKLGLDMNGKYVRHPLSFLSEAADDICYRVLDLEDAVELNLVTSKQVRDVFSKFLNGEDKDKQQPLSKLRGSVIQKLINESWSIFKDQFENIMTGQREKALKSDLPDYIRTALESVDSIYTEVFSEQFKVVTELGAYKSLGRILKALCIATRGIEKAPDWDELAFVSKRSLDLAWGKDYVQKHWEKSYRWWLHQVLDYVAGMTDNYAMQISRGIEGT
jgi:dGTPase